MADADPPPHQVPHPTSNLGLTIAQMRAKLTDPVQRRALDELYELVPAPMRDDMALLVRNLKANQWKVQESKDMIQKAQEWRELNKPEQITPDQMPAKIASGFLEWCGYDKFGRATLWARAAKHFPDEKLWEQTKKYIIFKMEQGIRLTEAKGNEQIVVLYDREHVTRKNFDLNMLKELAAVFNIAYAERLAKVCILKTDLLFSTLFAVVKPFLDPVTLKKVAIMPKDYKAALLDSYDKDQLHPDHGGTGCIVALNATADIATNLPPPRSDTAAFSSTSSSAVAAAAAAVVVIAGEFPRGRSSRSSNSGSQSRSPSPVSKL